MTERRVEIIDDDVDFANALGEFLALNGYSVQTAHDGARAQALMCEFEPEVALVDLRLGSDSGLDVIARLKQHRPGLICVIVTAFAEIETAIEAARRGAFEYLKKPLYNDEVLAILDRCFEKRRLELEKEKAEAALVASEARCRAILKSVVDGIISIDERGTILFINPAAERTFGYRPNEVVGRNVSLLMPEPYRSEHDGHLARYLDTGEARVIGIGREVEGQRKDGSVFPLDLAVSSVCQEGRTVFIGVVRDISERKRAEEALRESEARNRAVLESVIDGIISIDERGTIQSINPATEHIFGYRSDEMVGRNVSLLMPEPYHSEHDGYLARYLDTGEAHIIGIGREVEGRRKDGSTFPLDLAVSRLPEEGRTLFIGIVRDVTERKRTKEALQRAHDELEARVEERTRELTVEIAERWRIEAALRAAKEAAETANRAKTEFLAAMSHELRTPLNAILGFSEVLKISPDFSLGEKQDEYLDIIMQSGGHLLELINDILDVSAIEAGKLQLNDEYVDVAKLAEASVQLVRARAAEAKVGLSTSLPETGLRLHSDERRMKQILLNLLSNAVKFTPEGGDVSLDVYLADDGSMVFSVSDTGIGMDKAGLAKAMTMFGQVDGSLSRQYEGAGLGLPLTQRMVEAHGGTLEIESKPDLGTTAVVRIPARRVVDLSNNRAPAR